MTGGAACDLVLTACDATRALAIEGPRATEVSAEALAVSDAGAVATAVNESSSWPADCAASGAEARASAAIAANENRAYTFIDFPPEQ